jgi:hypothetical protein
VSVGNNTTNILTTYVKDVYDTAASLQPNSTWLEFKWSLDVSNNESILKQENHKTFTFSLKIVVK